MQCVTYYLLFITYMEMIPLLFTSQSAACDKWWYEKWYRFCMSREEEWIRMSSSSACMNLHPYKNFFWSCKANWHGNVGRKAFACLLVTDISPSISFHCVSWILLGKFWLIRYKVERSGWIKSHRIKARLIAASSFINYLLSCMMTMDNGISAA